MNLEDVLLNKKTTTILIRSRFCLFFGFYGALLFSEGNNKSFFKCLRYVVNSVKSKKKISLSVTLLAIDSLLKIIFNKKLRKRNVHLIKEIFKLFVKKLSKIHYPQFYDLIETIIKSFRKSLAKCEEELINLAELLIHLIITRINKAVKKTKKKTLLLSKSFNILSSLIEYRLIPLIKMDELLMKLYQVLEKPNKIRLETEIFGLIVKLIEKQEYISPGLEKIFNILPNCFRINDFELDAIFHLLNCFLYLGKDYIANNINALEQVNLSQFIYI